MRAPCVTCSGPTLMTAVAGEFLLVVLDTLLAKVFSFLLPVCLLVGD